VSTVIPLPVSTTRRCPAESITIPRGPLMPPAILTARHPLATVDAYLAAETPEHDAGIGVDCRGTTAE